MVSLLAGNRSGTAQHVTQIGEHLAGQGHLTGCHQEVDVDVGPGATVVIQPAGEGGPLEEDGPHAMGAEGVDHLRGRLVDHQALDRRQHGPAGSYVVHPTAG